MLCYLIGKKWLSIALFTVNFSHLHYNVFEHGFEAISGRNNKIARNCLTSTFQNIVMQMKEVTVKRAIPQISKNNFNYTAIKNVNHLAL